MALSTCFAYADRVVGRFCVWVSRLCTNSSVFFKRLKNLGQIFSSSQQIQVGRNLSSQRAPDVGKAN